MHYLRAVLRPVRMSTTDAVVAAYWNRAPRHGGPVLCVVDNAPEAELWQVAVAELPHGSALRDDAAHVAAARNRTALRGVHTCQHISPCTTTDLRAPEWCA